MDNVNKLKNVITGATTAPQYFRNALFREDNPAGKETKEERETTSEEERGGRRAKSLWVEEKSWVKDGKQLQEAEKKFTWQKKVPKICCLFCLLVDTYIPLADQLHFCLMTSASF